MTTNRISQYIKPDNTKDHLAEIRIDQMWAELEIIRQEELMYNMVTIGNDAGYYEALGNKRKGEYASELMHRRFLEVFDKYLIEKKGK